MRVIFIIFLNLNFPIVANAIKCGELFRSDIKPVETEKLRSDLAETDFFSSSITGNAKYPEKGRLTSVKDRPMISRHNHEGTVEILRDRRDGTLHLKERYHSTFGRGQRERELLENRTHLDVIIVYGSPSSMSQQSIAYYQNSGFRSVTPIRLNSKYGNAFDVGVAQNGRIEVRQYGADDSHYKHTYSGFSDPK